MGRGDALAIVPWSAVLSVLYLLVSAACDVVVLRRLGAASYLDVAQ
jgi:hypothetical protein